MKVCEKVQKKGVTTYNEVADELVAEFSSSDNHMSPNDSVSAAAARHLQTTEMSDLTVLITPADILNLDLIYFFFHF